MTEQSPSPMSHVAHGTRVTYPQGATTGTSRVLATGSWGLIAEETPFHPSNPRWPDQPADTGTVEIAGRSLSVVDCLVGAVEFGSRRLVIGGDIPVPHGADGWHWVVVHVLDQDPMVMAGADVLLRVDAVRRHELAAAHTARHLSGLALNLILAPLWSAGMPPDCLGHPDFDALALSSSTVLPGGFRDTYRIRTGSARGGGNLNTEDRNAEDLDSQDMDDLITVLGQAVTDRIQRWLARRAPVRRIVAGPYLADRRVWECDLAQGTVSLACDGVHAADLSAIADIQVIAELSATRTELALSGSVRAAAAGARPRTGPSRAARHLHTGLIAIRH